jgi:thymidylate synthase ThyX
MKVFIYDEFGPQDTAMMQALYSRSAESVEVHAEKVKASGSGKFMEKFYDGYGHASIADCGSTTLFIEGVSMLVAKAIQDWPLNSGQETSSRYIDMSKQKLVDPIGTSDSKKILEKWMKFYTESQGEVEKHLIEKYARKPGEDEAVYLKAIKARTRLRPPSRPQVIPVKRVSHAVTTTQAKAATSPRRTCTVV